MRVLVFSAHPDDEIIGAGGTILKHVESGDTVFWAFYTLVFKDSSEKFKRRRECVVAKVSKEIGFSDSFFLGFHSGELDNTGFTKMIKRTETVIEKTKPEVIYTVGPCDVNSDHDYVYKTVMICTKPSNAPYIKRILTYEITSSTNWSYPELSKVFLPNYYSDISKFLNRKIEIMKLFQEEVKEYPHPRSVQGVRALARYRGSSVHLDSAEAFTIMREIG